MSMNGKKFLVLIPSFWNKAEGPRVIKYLTLQPLVKIFSELKAWFARVREEEKGRGKDVEAVEVERKKKTINRKTASRVEEAEEPRGQYRLVIRLWEQYYIYGINKHWSYGKVDVCNKWDFLIIDIFYASADISRSNVESRELRTDRGYQFH